MNHLVGRMLYSAADNGFKSSTVNIDLQISENERRSVVTLSDSNINKQFDRLELYNNLSLNLDGLAQALAVVEVEKIYENTTGEKIGFFESGDMVMTLDKQHRENSEVAYIVGNYGSNLIVRPIVYPDDSVTIGKNSFLGLVYEPVIDLTQNLNQLGIIANADQAFENAINNLGE